MPRLTVYLVLRRKARWNNITMNVLWGMKNESKIPTNMCGPKAWIQIQQNRSETFMPWIPTVTQSHIITSSLFIYLFIIVHAMEHLSDYSTNPTSTKKTYLLFFFFLVLFLLFFLFLFFIISSNKKLVDIYI